MEKSNCLNCGKILEYYPSQRKQYCDNKCQGQLRSKKSSKTWFRKGTRWYHNRRHLVLEEKGNQCQDCGITDTWNGKPITLCVDHINGDRTDNRMENFRVLCWNCHSQTETFGCKNKSH